MEDGKVKKKNTVSIPVFNGGGIAGVLVIGGALATAALIAFFARRTPKKKAQSKASDSSKNVDFKNTNSNLLDEKIENFNQCCESDELSEVESDQIDQKELISTQNSELEAFSELEINGGKETRITDDDDDDDESFLPKMISAESISLCKDINIDTEELAVQVNKIHDAEEEPPFVEAVEELKKDDEASKIVFGGKLQENVINDEATIDEGAFSEKVIEEDVEENQLMMSEEEDSDDHVDEDDEFDEEEIEKSSVETGDSSMESNAEPIWPTETIEKLSAIKDMNFNDQDSGEKIKKKDGTVEKDSNINEYECIRESMAISDNKGTDELLTVNHQTVRSGDMRMLILSILGTVLLLLMLGFVTEHKAMFLYLLNGDLV